MHDKESQHGDDGVGAVDVLINGTRMNIGKEKEKAGSGECMSYLTNRVKAAVAISELVFSSDTSIKCIWRQMEGELGTCSPGPFRDFLGQTVTHICSLAYLVIK